MFKLHAYTRALLFIDVAVGGDDLPAQAESTSHGRRDARQKRKEQSVN